MRDAAQVRLRTIGLTAHSRWPGDDSSDEDTAMGSYLLRRLVLMLLTLFGMSVLIFVAAAPGARQHRRHPVRLRRHRRPAQKLKIEHELGLDRRSSFSTGNGSAACCRAISAMPMSPSSRRSRRSRRAFR